MQRNEQSPQNRKPDAYKKLKVASDLYDFAYQIKKHRLRLKHPARDEKWLHSATVELIQKACR